MESKMQTFVMMKKSFALLGVSKVNLLQKNRINIRNMTALMWQSGAAISNCVYLLYEAETFNDYAIGIYSGSSLIVGVILFIISILHMRQINKCLDNIERLVNESKFQLCLPCMPYFRFQKYSELFQDWNILNREKSTNKWIHTWKKWPPFWSLGSW